MFCQKHRLKIASLRIGKHRIVKKTEHRPPLFMKDCSEADMSMLVKMKRNFPLKIFYALQEWGGERKELEFHVLS